MKRRQMLTLLGLIPTVMLYACERKELSRATIITGKIIDQNGSPLAGVPLSMSGDNGKFLSPGVRTFVLDAVTDKSGQFKFSQQVPRKTDFIYFLLSNDEIITPLVTHKVYLEKNGVYVEIKYSDFEIPRDTWGQTTTLNFKYEKI